MLRTLLGAALLAIAPVTLLAADFEQGRVIDGQRHVLDWRDRPAVENRILMERLDKLLPELMAETGIDMWLVMAREYAEDPVYLDGFEREVRAVHAAKLGRITAGQRMMVGTRMPPS